MNQTLTEVCSCIEVKCEIGKKCISTGCEVDPSQLCLIGDTSVEFCVECTLGNLGQCALCKLGYEVVSNKCVFIDDCMNGTSLIPHCIKCKDGDRKNECDECSDSYFIDSNECKQNTCLQGVTIVEHCTECVHDAVTYCRHCSEGYLVMENHCVLEGELNMCETDFDCTETEFCLLKKCHSFVEHETKCHRTNQCEANNTVCRVPGASFKN